jgi:hypothetical protein
MSQFRNEVIAVACALALAQNLRVKYDGSFNLVAAGSSDVELGTLRDASFAAGDVRSVLLRNVDGTKVFVASEAITKGTDVYAASSGKVASTGTIKVGTALEAAAADGDWIEVLPLGAVSGSFGGVVPKTANYTVTTGDSGTTFTTVGAGAAVTFAMPAATLGLRYKFRVGAAQELRIDPNGTETIALPSTGVQGAAGKYLTADADGESVSIECTKTGQWTVFGYTGTWTAEA